MKIGIPLNENGNPRIGHLQRRLLEKEFEITHNLEEADLIFYWNTISDKGVDLNKVVVFVQESPLAAHRRWLYANPYLFHTIVLHDPDPSRENQIRFSDDPSVFPWTPAEERDIRRKDTTITNRIVFYAGARKHDNYATIPDDFNTIRFCIPRTKMVNALSKYPNVRIYGKGWEPEIGAIEGKSTQTLYGGNVKVLPGVLGNWRLDKIQDVEDCGADFHLCVENCIQKNLITDHFHDGFSSDRVVLYLGCPNIDEFVPTNCFVDLRPYFDSEKKELDVKKVMEIVKNMTQEEYDRILTNARKWRKSIKGKYNIESIKFTKRVIARIKNES